MVYSIRNPKDTLVSMYHHLLAASFITEVTTLGEIMQRFLHSKYSKYLIPYKGIMGKLCDLSA